MNHDAVVWLLAKRDELAVARDEAFEASDLVTANKIAIEVESLFDASCEITKGRDIIKVMEKALVNRVVVALTHAETPPWKATHRHYKGTLYRVTGKRQDASGQELVDGVEYDDAAGNRYFLPQIGFESLLDSNKPRYRPLYDWEN